MLGTVGLARPNFQVFILSSHIRTAKDLLYLHLSPCLQWVRIRDSMRAASASASALLFVIRAPNYCSCGPYKRLIPCILTFTSSLIHHYQSRLGQSNPAPVAYKDMTRWKTRISFSTRATLVPCRLASVHSSSPRSRFIIVAGRSEISPVILHASLVKWRSI